MHWNGNGRQFRRWRAAVGAGVGVNIGMAVAVGSPALTAVGVGVGIASATSTCRVSTTPGCSRSHATHSSAATTIAERHGTRMWNAPALTRLTISIRATPSSPHDFDCHTFIISASFAAIANTMPACCMMYQAYSHQMLAAESSFPQKQEYTPVIRRRAGGKCSGALALA